MSAEVCVAEEGIRSVARVRRLLNESIRDGAARVEDGSSRTIEFVCECGDLRCDRVVRLTRDEYDSHDALLRAHL